MCPDKKLLSVYCDGELPEAVSKHLEAHVASCGACSRTLAEYQAISGQLEDKPQDASEAQARVWRKLEAAMEGHALRRRSRTIWRREIRLPLPVAAAAAVLLVGSAVVAFQFASQKNAIPQLAESENGDDFVNLYDDPLVSHGGEAHTAASNINDVLQFIEDDKYPDTVVIKLPEGRNFNRYGEPKLINASDYPGGRGR